MLRTIGKNIRPLLSHRKIFLKNSPILTRYTSIQNTPTAIKKKSSAFAKDIQPKKWVHHFIDSFHPYKEVPKQISPSLQSQIHKTLTHFFEQAAL